jgi:hypothetical protein
MMQVRQADKCSILETTKIYTNRMYTNMTDTKNGNPGL